MKDRIKQIMDKEQLTPSAFADRLQLGRAVISHILNGRNNPSLDVVTRILAKFDYINSNWLLTGDGAMSKSEKNNSDKQNNFISNNFGEKTMDLFSQVPIYPSNDKENIEYRKENIVERVENRTENTENKTIMYQKAPDRKITKIIIYYSDNTFETFDADNRPL